MTVETYEVESSEKAEQLANKHYENFPVATPFLSEERRRHIRHIYAYARCVDDIGDEVPGGKEKRLSLLEQWEGDLERVYSGTPEHPVMQNLQETVQACDIPPEPFRHLIRANRIDQYKNRYDSFSELLAYCRYSANPCGRLYLRVCGYDSEELFQMADWTCSALQLTNFWQDVGRDLKQNRIYIPAEFLNRYQFENEDIHRLGTQKGKGTPERFFRMMDELIQKTYRLYARGLELVKEIPSDLKLDILLFSLGGIRLQEKLQDQGYPVFRKRVQLQGWERLRLFGRALWYRISGGVDSLQRTLLQKSGPFLLNN